MLVQAIFAVLSRVTKVICCTREKAEESVTQIYTDGDKIQVSKCNYTRSMSTVEEGTSL